MNIRVMLLPSHQNPEKSRLVALPDDMSDKEALRKVTGIVGELQDGGSASWEDDILPALEDHGFETVETYLGPTLDQD